MPTCLQVKGKGKGKAVPVLELSTMPWWQIMGA
jgi:hypothetical protein